LLPRLQETEKIKIKISDGNCRVTAMTLVWDYGERTGLKGWKGLSWGMVSLSFDKDSPIPTF
jgi:hypothetical protein